MAKKKPIESSADKQRENSGRENVEPYKWRPGQSGKPNGRPPKALAQISIDKELGDQPCPEKIWKEIERQILGCVPPEWKPPTWLQCEVVKNRIPAMSLTRGDAMAIARWQMADGKPRIQRIGRRTDSNANPRLKEADDGRPPHLTEPRDQSCDKKR
jgi:hypothetical protein